MLSMLNLLQFIFLGIRLDGVVQWSWAVSAWCCGLLVALVPVSFSFLYCICDEKLDESPGPRLVYLVT